MKLAPGMFLLVLGTFVALTVAAYAPAKEGARARLTTAVPLAAKPGTTMRVRWTVGFPGNNGGRPFNALGMFVKLLSRTGAGTTMGFASGTARPDGRYSAEVRVPEGGIGGIRIGLRGTTDIFFPVANDPFTSTSGVRCDVAAARATLAAFVRAYNRGDLRRLDRLFSREPRFLWYSWGGTARSDRAALVPNFRRRHERGDRLRSLTFRFNGYERERDVGHLELHAERRADDLQQATWFQMAGKAALDCSKPPATFALMFLGAR